jgi:hypothetical protein
LRCRPVPTFVEQAWRRATSICARSFCPAERS